MLAPFSSVRSLVRLFARLLVCVAWQSPICYIIIFIATIDSLTTTSARLIYTSLWRRRAARIRASSSTVAASMAPKLLPNLLLHTRALTAGHPTIQRATSFRLIKQDYATWLPMIVIFYLFLSPSLKSCEPRRPMRVHCSALLCSHSAFQTHAQTDRQTQVHTCKLTLVKPNQNTHIAAAAAALQTIAGCTHSRPTNAHRQTHEQTHTAAPRRPASLALCLKSRKSTIPSLARSAC